MSGCIFATNDLHAALDRAHAIERGPVYIYRNLFGLYEVRAAPKDESGYTLIASWDQG